jgi:competence protein ComEC
MVIELQYGQVSLLLTGDIGQDVERLLAAQLGPAGLRALKVPHHGSSTSSSPEFVSALKPRVAFLSAGATTKVSDDVLRRYQEVGATLYRTDIHGAITLETDGSSVTVKTFTGEHGTFMK